MDWSPILISMKTASVSIVLTFFLGILAAWWVVSMKNERMKTELVTNVSHDLRTPLTAIITYTDLLKNEKDEEKRKEYISVLERKSLRLKVLIEDLFEISKAARRYTMNSG